MHILGLNRATPLQSLVTQSDLQKQRHVIFLDVLNARDPFDAVPTLPSVMPDAQQPDSSIDDQPIPMRRNSTRYEAPMTFVNQ